MNTTFDIVTQQVEHLLDKEFVFILEVMVVTMILWKSKIFSGLKKPENSHGYYICFRGAVGSAYPW